MARRPASNPADLTGDPGVLQSTPTLEVFGSAAVAIVGGVAILPNRAGWLSARQTGLEAIGWFDKSDRGPFKQALVHLQKGRAATEQGLAEAWARLETDGRLILVGGNELGIKSAIKRLAAGLEQPAEVLANRARARAVCWHKNDQPLEPPPIGDIEVATPSDRFTLHSAAGVFSADGLDPGTALLLENIEDLHIPNRIFDPGCGLGVLSLAALRRWPEATAVLADVDHRAVSCARLNAAELGLDDRSDLHWWDAVSEPSRAADCDLVLVNPPFHTGVPVDLQPARAIFRAIDDSLIAGGRALVVANRTLPWERDLRTIGSLRQIADTRGYKILELRK